MPVLKSKTISFILTLFLAVSLGLSLVSGIMTLIYIGAEDFYYDYLSNLDNYFSTADLFIYYFIIILYLIWLFQIHRDLKRCFSFYPISPWGALFRMMPIVSIWGIGDTFITLGKFIKRYDHSLGKWIHILIPFLYITLFTVNFMNKMLKKNWGSASDNMLLTALMFEIAFAVVILLMTIFITKGMNKALAAESDKVDVVMDASVVKVMSHYMENFNSVTGIKDLITESFIKDVFYTMYPNDNRIISFDEMVLQVRDNQRLLAPLVGYKVEDYAVLDDETCEVTIRREFSHDTTDQIMYLLHKEPGGWKLHRIIRLLEGIVTEISHHEEGSLYSMEMNNKTITLLDRDQLLTQEEGPEEAKIWALWNLDNMNDGERNYVLYKKINKK